MSDKLLSPIQRSSISEQVAEKLESLIRDRKLQLGEQLPSEQQLTEMLGVGRATVRKALRILEIKGYVECRHGVGTFVKDFEGDLRLPLSIWLADRNEVLSNFFEIRLIIEPNAASLAAKRITDEEIDELRRVHEEFRKHVQEQDLPKAVIVDAKFHKLLARSTKNKMLAMTMETLNKSVIEGWMASLRAAGRTMKTVQEHEAIIEALTRRDSKKAANIMKQHLEDAFEDLKTKGLSVEEEED